ncbi:hypothetical protein GEMRC1_002302 [Eukaryota sp. GEM-RC1]
MHRTIVIRRDYLHWVPKYKRYEKRHSNIAVHLSPAFKVKDGDIVTFGECRPISKTVHFNVLAVDAQEPHSKKKVCSFLKLNLFPFFLVSLHWFPIDQFLYALSKYIEIIV